MVERSRIKKKSIQNVKIYTFHCCEPIPAPFLSPMMNEIPLVAAKSRIPLILMRQS